MFKNCTFNINILPDDKHQQEQSDNYVKLGDFDYQEPTESLLQELHLVKGADYYWQNNSWLEACELWVLPTRFGQVYDAIHSSAGVLICQANEDVLNSSLYRLLKEHKTVRIEFVTDAIYNIYKVSQNAN
jgi:hypothetical protein